MKPSIAMTALVSFVSGAVVALTATSGFAGPARAAKPSQYTNAVYGYSIVPPAFAKAEKDGAAQTVSFFAPARKGFATNLGIIVQMVKMTLDEYCDLSTGQFKQAGLKIVSETRKKVSGKNAVLWEYEGTLQQGELKWIALAVIDTDRVFLITGTTTPAEYAQVEKELRASLDTFAIEE